MLNEFAKKSLSHVFSFKYTRICKQTSIARLKESATFDTKSSYLGGALSLVMAVCPVDCVIISQSEQARLVGSSFGISSVDVTYDYVVSA